MAHFVWRLLKRNRKVRSFFANVTIFALVHSVRKIKISSLSKSVLMGGDSFLARKNGGVLELSKFKGFKSAVSKSESSVSEDSSKESLALPSESSMTTAFTSSLSSFSCSSSSPSSISDSTSDSTDSDSFSGSITAFLLFAADNRESDVLLTLDAGPLGFDFRLRFFRFSSRGSSLRTSSSENSIGDIKPAGCIGTSLLIVCNNPQRSPAFSKSKLVQTCFQASAAHFVVNTRFSDAVNPLTHFSKLSADSSKKFSISSSKASFQAFPGPASTN
eukprot:Pompholyxophrys_punicea_v1_NODE_465_length_1897_cov_12.178610.p1 type:complete len:274 gc:universal NODE_465_length_1897_cov_12.178610:1735-914(-)